MFKALCNIVLKVLYFLTWYEILYFAQKCKYIWKFR